MAVNESLRNSNISLYSPIYEKLQIDNNGFVLTYSSLEDEYKQMKYGVGTRDATSLSIIEMQGNETLEFLHRVSTNSVKDLKPFTACKTIFTNEKGRIIDKVNLLNIEKSVMLICHRAVKDKLFFWVNKYIIMEDIKTRDAAESYFVYEFFGNQVNSFLKMFFGNDVDTLMANEVVVVNLDGRDFYLTRYNEHSIVYYRVIGFANDKEFFFKYLYENKSAFDFGMVGEDAYNISRVEHGISGCPGEINDTVNPYEANIIADVSTTKGCFIGQEVIARLDTYDKVQRKLTGIIFNEECSINLPAVLLNDEGEEAGIITSSVNSFLFKKQIGLALIKKPFSGNEIKLHIKEKGNCTVTVSNLPFSR